MWTVTWLYMVYNTLSHSDNQWWSSERCLSRASQWWKKNVKYMVTSTSCCPCSYLVFSHLTWQALRWHILELLLWWTAYNRDKESPCNSHMRREHVFTKCTQCGWRQRSHTIGGKICFDEYYCKRCGGQLLICVRIQLTKGKQNMLPLVIRETRACLLTYTLRMGGYWVV